MRLMLGLGGKPSLLISTEKEHSPDHFDFWVINGAWEGTYHQGNITCWSPYAPWSNLDKVDILSDNQDRLGGDYNDVFANWDNSNYVHPKRDEVLEYDDDDVPF